MLFLKMIRDIKRNIVSYMACIIVVATGLLIFTCMSLVSDNLNSARDRFYENANFADGFISVKGIPYSKIDNLEKIKGINQIEGRVTKDVRVYSEDNNESKYLRLISIDLDKENHLNKPVLISGNYLKDNVNNILVDDNFFKANNLKIGDKISLIIDGKKVDLNISGTEMSPDFVYAMKSGQDLFPDPENFGIAYVPYSYIKPYLKEKTLVNDLSFNLDKNVKYKDVSENLKSSLTPYSLNSIYERKDQPSNLMLSQELKGLEGMAKSLPIMFLGIAAFILYIMLKRTIELQRGQIGILKSFGYTSREILYHYISYAVFVGLIGGILGGISGIALASPMTEMYKQYFSIPNITSSFSIYYTILGVVISLAVSIAAGFQGSKRVLKLQPAEAMRPDVPKTAGKTKIEKVKFIWNSLNSQGKMAVRNIFRNKGRSFFTLVGTMFAFSLMCTFFNSLNMFDVMFNEQYEKVQLYDCKISFQQLVNSGNMVNEIVHRKEVKAAEPMLEVAVNLKNSWREKNVAIIGLTSESKLYNILDKNGSVVKLPDSGLVLSKRAAQVLDAKVGTVLEVESSLWGDEKKKIYVSKIVPQYLGMNAFMSQKQLSRLIGNNNYATSLILKISPSDIESFKEYCNKSPIITAIEVKADSIKKINDMLKTSILVIWSLLVFSVIIGFIIIYTSSDISFSERERELASLRVMGFSEKEVLEVLSTEQFFISVFSIIIGIPVVKLMMGVVVSSMNSDLYSIPSMIGYKSILAGIIGTWAALLLAKSALKLKIKKLDLVNVLKERE